MNFSKTGWNQELSSSSDFFEYARPRRVYFPATSPGNITFLSSIVPASIAGNCFPITCAKSGVQIESKKRTISSGLITKRLPVVSQKIDNTRESVWTNHKHVHAS